MLCCFLAFLSSLFGSSSSSYRLAISARVLIHHLVYFTFVCFFKTIWLIFVVFFSCFHVFFCGVFTDYTVYTWCTVVVVIACNSSWSCSKTAYLLVCSFCLCMCLLCLFVRGIIYFYGTIMATANERIAPGSSQSSFKRGIFLFEYM